MKGFSERNLYYTKKRYKYWNEILPQVVAELEENALFSIPWGHHREIITKIKDKEEAIFYVAKRIENIWSRNILVLQIESKLYFRQGGAITNFKEKLPEVYSDLANETLKDPYCFDFLTLTETYNERELGDKLVENITKFLLELGQGFSYIGRQYQIKVSNKDFYINLLFYHVKLHTVMLL